MSIDVWINEQFAGISGAVFSVLFYGVPIPGVMDTAGEQVTAPLLLLWLAAASLFFTFYLGFINIRYFKHAIDVLRGKYDAPGESGQLGRFQALATSLSGTVGLGNIAGVAAAISLGGPGAAFWMMVMGLFGMSTKFVEVMLGVKYLHHGDKDDPEKVSGGPMYYLRDIFANRNIPYVGHVLAAIFAIFCIGGAIGGGNMFQSNQAYGQFVNVTGGDDSWWSDKGWLFGLILAFLVGLVIIGGIKSIARVTSKLVPVMGGIYLLAGILVIIMNLPDIPAALVTIFQMALAPEAGIGGFVGALLVGVQRASFSNEAGLGSAAIVHSTAKTNQPVSQGFVGMLGPFIDTVVICTITALVIVVTGAWQEGKSVLDAGGSLGGLRGVELTSDAFETTIPGSRYVLSLVVFMFAYSTLLTWSYYGTKAVTYLFGEKRGVEVTFKLIFCGFTVVGTSATLGNVIDFTDAMILSMAIPNLIGLYFVAPEVKRDIKEYIQYIKNNGTLTGAASKA